MSKLKYLVKMNFKQYFTIAKDKKAKKKQVGMTVLMAACFLPLIAILCFAMYFMASGLQSIGEINSLIASILFMAQLVVLFFGTATFLSIMFFSKDNEFLMTLPVKTTEIYLSKMLIVYLSHILLSTVVLLPALITIGIAAKITSAVFYILIPFALALTPLIPLLIISLIALPLSYLVNFFRKNNGMATIMYLVVFVGLMSLYFVFIGSLSNGTSMDFNAIAKTFNVLSTIIYPNLFIANAMVGVNNVAINLIAYFGILIVAGVLSIFLSMLLYRKVATKFLEVGVKAGRVRELKSGGSQIKVMMMRDLKTMLRDSSFALNCFMGIILTPIMAVVMTVLNPGFAENMTEPMMQMSKMTMAVYLCSIMLIGTNYLSVIAISREGEKFYMIKYLPITPIDFIKSKLLLSDIYVISGSVLCSIALMFCGINIFNCLAFAVCLSGFGLALNAYAINKDLKAPKLNWINTSQLLKRNMAVMRPMLIAMGVGLIIMVVGILLPTLVSGLNWWMCVIYWAVFALLDIILWILFRRKIFDNAVMYFNKIEASNG